MGINPARLGPRARAQLPAEIQRGLADPDSGKPKFRNKQTVIDGIRFPSKGEANRYHLLLLLQKAGEIKYLTPHPALVIVEKSDGQRQLHAEFDAAYQRTDNQNFCIEDFKGRDNAKSRLKRAVAQQKYGLRIHLVSTPTAPLAPGQRLEEDHPLVSLIRLAHKPNT